MILKETDPKDRAIAELEALLTGAPGDRREKIERELNIVRAGLKGERESAYLIDFDYGKRDNWIVIHDLRLELNDRVAQIDHLMINRILTCVVLESKHFRAGLKITDDGEFLRWNDYKKTYEGMASPLAQNERHIAVLRDAFAKIEMPTRLGVRLSPAFHNYVLVSPEARIIRPDRFDSSHVIKADILTKTLDAMFERMGVLDVVGGLSKMVSADTLQEIGRALVAMHRPTPFNPAARFATGDLPGGTGPLVAERKVPAKPPSGPLVGSVTPLERKGDVAPRCRKCNSRAVSIHYGQYGYYFKCADCQGNTPIQIGCGQPGHKERIRKEALKFFRECAECGTSDLYFINPG